MKTNLELGSSVTCTERPDALSFEPRDRSRHPLRRLHFRRVWNLPAHFRYLRRGQDPLACDVSQFPMNGAGEVYCLLAEYDAASSVSEMPIEDRQAAPESMCLATRIDDELQWNVVRRAAVSEHGLRADGTPVVGEHRLLESGWLTQRFSRRWRAALRHDDCSLLGRQNAEISVSVDIDGFIGLCGRWWCLPGARCLRSRLSCDERDYEQGTRCLHGGDDLACHSNAETRGLTRDPSTL
jgi:hypothetical protein